MRTGVSISKRSGTSGKSVLPGQMVSFICIETKKASKYIFSLRAWIYGLGEIFLREPPWAAQQYCYCQQILTLSRTPHHCSSRALSR